MRCKYRINWTYLKEEPSPRSVLITAVAHLEVIVSDRSETHNEMHVFDVFMDMCKQMGLDTSRVVTWAIKKEE